jgi:TetR/AcrR family transcriptional repressor of mexJK operon
LSTPKRNRPLDSAKHSKILDAAIKLFLNKGIEEVAMAEIAAKADVAKQTVYSHFGNKENLFHHAMLHALDRRIISQLDIDLSIPIQDFLSDFAQMMVMALVSEEGLKIQRVMVNNTITSQELRGTYWKDGPSAIQKLLTDYLKNKAKQGEINIPNVDFAAQQFYYMLKARANALALLGLKNQSEMKSLKDYAENCVELFLRGYRNV